MWASGRDVRAIAGSEVHVWRVAFETPPAQAEAWLQALSDDERARAARFHFERDRKAFSLCRAVLRGLLGRYLDRPPEALHLATGPHGKPHLVDPAGELEFNLSHSGGLGLIAIARRGVGVDVECLRDMPRLEAMAQRVFTESEQAYLRQVPDDQRLGAFFFGWVQKEAYLKAIGAGLSVSMQEVEVSLSEAEGARLRSRRGQPEEAARWKLVGLDLGPRFKGALAAAGHDWQHSCYDLP